MSKALIITILATVIIAVGATAVYITKRQEGEEVKEQPVETSGEFTPELERLVEESLRVHKQAANYYFIRRLIYGADKARQMTVDWLKKQSIVKDAGIDDGTIWMEFIFGGEAAVLTK